jgi:hypothetical protein
MLLHAGQSSGIQKKSIRAIADFGFAGASPM